MAIAGLRALVMVGKTDEHEENFMEMVSRLSFVEKNSTGEAGPKFGGGSFDEEEQGDGLPTMVDVWGGIAKIFQSGTDPGIEAFNPGDRPSEAPSAGGDGVVLRRGFEKEHIAAVLEKGGELELCDAIRCRVRYFCDGVVLGSRAFVEAFFSANRRRFGKRRKSGARRLRGIRAPDLFSIRELGGGSRVFRDR